MKRVAFKVLGCKVNSYEVQGIKQDFIKNGYEVIDNIEEVADIYVINTCTVTNTSDKKSRQAIRKCVRLNPEAIVIVMGCYSQLKPDEVLEIEGVDIVVGTQNRDKIIQYIDEYIKDRKPQLNVENIMKQTEFEKLNVSFYKDKTRGFLKIQEGCNNFCTFCIIPWARGLIRSQDPKSVIEQAKQFVENGISEIVLTGIHTGGYGEDLENYAFVDLLEDLEKIVGLKRIRISSIEITQLGDDFLKYLKHTTKLANHLHIPIQSGDDYILKKMKRNYTLKEFEQKVMEIRNIKRDISISTDVIVGFPFETDERFTNTCNTIKRLKINNLHVFPYSKRNGTPAAKMEEQVDEQVKKQRVNELIEIGYEINYEYNKQFVGKKLDVIVEKQDEDGYYIGYSSNYIKCKLISELNIQKGQLVQVEVVEVQNQEVIAKLK